LVFRLSKGNLFHSYRFSAAELGSKSYQQLAAIVAQSRRQQHKVMSERVLYKKKTLCPPIFHFHRRYGNCQKRTNIDQQSETANFEI